MTVEEFKDYVKTGKPLDSPEIFEVLNNQSDEARKITFSFTLSVLTSFLLSFKTFFNHGSRR